MHRRLPLPVALLVLSCSSPMPDRPAQPAAATTKEDRTRVLVLTDIGNEPDDAQSFVRFLLYANEFDIEGLVATTSTWQRGKVQPQLLRERIEAYRKVRENLLVHATGYPKADELLALVRSGSSEYGIAAVGEGKDTEGSEWIIEVVDRPEPRPLWIPIWGGAVDLAQALWKVRETRTPEKVARFVSRIRAYAISDQDDAQPWIRRNFPELIYIVSIHAWARYGLSTWCGISGEEFYGFQGPPDLQLVSNEWLDEHIRKDHGPLGALYPWTEYIMEGDTPSFLYLIPNGLGSPEHPEYGSWGGRYEKSQEGSVGLYTDTLDTVAGAGGVEYTTNQATVWRWRQSYQHDFAARMDWTVAGAREGANHNPVVVLNGVEGRAPVEFDAAPGDKLMLSAAGTSDPDGDELTHRWWQYPEPSGRRPPEVVIENPSATEITIQAPKVSQPTALHIILEVTDNGTPALSAYRRALIRVSP